MTCAEPFVVPCQNIAIGAKEKPTDLKIGCSNGEARSGMSSTDSLDRQTTQRRRRRCLVLVSAQEQNGSGPHRPLPLRLRYFVAVMLREFVWKVASNELVALALGRLLGGSGTPGTRNIGIDHATADIATNPYLLVLC
jgi:hypothetical protein